MPQTAGGPYKVRLDNKEAYMADSVIFFGRGNLNYICRLMNHYLSNKIGKESTRGAGTISDFSVTEIDTDLSLVDTSRNISENGAMRSLPVHMYENFMGKQADDMDIEMLGILPPFHTSEKVPSIQPKRIQRIIL